jgi:hypothetical protein
MQAEPMPAETTIDDPEKSSASSAIILAIAVILVAIYCLAFELQNLVWVEGKLWAAANPWILDVPQPLPPISGPAKGTQLKAYDYEFLAPWPGNPKLSPAVTNVAFRYDAGPVVVFYDPETLLDSMRKVKSWSPAEYQKYANVFANNPIESNYSLYETVYSTSPAQISPIMSAIDAVRINQLLIWKLSFGFDVLPVSPPGIYSFTWGRIRGFQFGDPATGRPVAIRAFDDRDRQFRIIFTVAGGSRAGLTQDDISNVVGSIQPVPITDR